MGVQPRTFWALAGLPSSTSTSAGRRNFVDDHVLLVVQADVGEGDLTHVTHGGGDAGGDHVVIGVVLLQHEPHGLDVVAGKTPIALGINVAEVQLVLQAQLDARDRIGHLAGDEFDARRGDSWLNRMPLEACMPWLSR